MGGVTSPPPPVTVDCSVMNCTLNTTGNIFAMVGATVNVGDALALVETAIPEGRVATVTGIFGRLPDTFPDIGDVTFTLYKNGAPTGVTATCEEGEIYFGDYDAVATFVAGDLWAIRVISTEVVGNVGFVYIQLVVTWA